MSMLFTKKCYRLQSYIYTSQFPLVKRRPPRMCHTFHVSCCHVTFLLIDSLKTCGGVYVAEAQRSLVLVLTACDRTFTSPGLRGPEGLGQLRAESGGSRGGVGCTVRYVLPLGVAKLFVATWNYTTSLLIILCIFLPFPSPLVPSQTEGSCQKV